MVYPNNLIIVIPMMYPGIVLEQDYTPTYDTPTGQYGLNWEPSAVSKFGLKPTPEQVVEFMTSAPWLDYRRSERTDALKEEAENRIDFGIQPNTRKMLYAGILNTNIAENIREFMSATYEAVNVAIDLIEATDIDHVDDPSVDWPLYEG